MKENFEKFISAEAIAARVNELGEEISLYIEKNHIETLYVLWLAEGATYFAADLTRKIRGNILMRSVRVSSYGDSLTSTGVHLISGDFGGLEGASVLLVDDVLDSGATILEMTKKLESVGAKKISTCVLINKKIAGRKVGNPDFYGFETGSEFLVGYGMDFKNRMRNVSDILIYKGDCND